VICQTSVCVNFALAANTAFVLFFAATSRHHAGVYAVKLNFGSSFLGTVDFIAIKLVYDIALVTSWCNYVSPSSHCHQGRKHTGMTWHCILLL